MIEGQLSTAERAFLSQTLTSMPIPPAIALEVGTWLGGGSTLHILQAFQRNGTGHLWGIEYSREIHDRMVANLKSAIPEALHRFTPIFGRSQDVIPRWLRQEGAGQKVDFAFLDGGDSPSEQIDEFLLLDPHMRIGAQLMAHDARMRKGKWLVPFLQRLDHWKTELLDLSEVGLLRAEKVAERPSPESLRTAEAELRRLKREPRELVARLLPPAFRSLIARILPQKVMRALIHGGSKNQ
jgi:predicted O-methyltransferase YrrM